MKSAVIAIDLQHEFIGPEAVFPVLTCEEFIPRTQAFIAQARTMEVPIIFTAFAVPDAQPVGISTSKWADPRAHRYPHARLLDTLEISATDIILEKSRQSAFVGTSLELILRRLSVEHVVIIGVTTHSCCLATALDAAARDFTVTILSDLTASVPVRPTDSLPGMTHEESHQAALQLMGYSCGRVMTSETLLEEWSEGSAL